MIDCKTLAENIKRELLPLVTPDKQLAIIQVGDNPASNIYCKWKLKDAEELGVIAHYYNFPENVDNGKVLNLINELNRNDAIKGIIVQLPLPEHLNTDLLINAVVDEKDIDGFKATSKYTPCTPKGVMAILKSLNIPLAGKKCVLIGKGKTVGKPLINLLLDEGLTLTVCHSRTTEEDLDNAIINADIIISAVGQPNTVKYKHFVSPDGYLDTSKIIIDVGISRDEDGKQIGDAERLLHDVIPNITPYVNGCGVITRAMIFDNLLRDGRQNGVSYSLDQFIIDTMNKQNKEK